FDEKENVSNCIQLKTSVIKGIKNQLLDQFSDIDHEHIEILTVNGELLFFRQREGPFYPTLRLLHKEKVNKGVGVENVHYLNDGLWHMKMYK
ncbi:unnamed protein product, partial [Coregonus sp. 'balchen']